MKKIFTLAMLLVLMTFSINVNAQKFALNFDGTAESFIDAGQNDLFTPSVITLETWFNASDYAGGYLMATEGWNNDNGTSMGFSFRLSGDRQLEMSLGIGGAPNWSSCMTDTATILLNRWIHAAVTIDEAFITKIYLNGVLAKTDTLIGAPALSNQNLSIAEGAMWKGRNLRGMMHNIRMWSIVRTAAEIQANMNTDLSAATTGLVFEYAMKEGTGTTLADVNGTYNLTVPTAVTWVLREGLSVNLQGKYDISIYPNPVLNVLNLKNETSFNAGVVLYDVAGKRILEENLSAGQTKSIDVSVLHKGVYFVKFENEGFSTVKKIMKY